MACSTVESFKMPLDETASAKDRCYLLELPAELRIQIFQLALSMGKLSRSGALMDSIHTAVSWPENKPKRTNPWALAYTCKQINAECDALSQRVDTAFVWVHHPAPVTNWQAFEGMAHISPAGLQSTAAGLQRITAGLQRTAATVSSLIIDLGTVRCHSDPLFKADWKQIRAASEQLRKLPVPVMVRFNLQLCPRALEHEITFSLSDSPDDFANGMSVLWGCNFKRAIKRSGCRSCTRNNCWCAQNNFEIIVENISCDMLEKPKPSRPTEHQD